MSFSRNGKDIGIGDFTSLFHKKPNTVPTPLGARIGVLLAGLKDTREKGSWRHTHINHTEMPVPEFSKAEPNHLDEADSTASETGQQFTPEAPTSIPEIGQVGLLRRIGGAIMHGYQAASSLSERFSKYRELQRPSAKVLFVAAGVLAVAGVAVATIENTKRDPSA